MGQFLPTLVCCFHSFNDYKVDKNLLGKAINISQKRKNLKAAKIL